MIPGAKYVLRADNDLGQNDACIWNGTKLVLANSTDKAEFFVQQFELNLTPPPYDSALFGERPRFTPMLVEHEGWFLTAEELANTAYCNGLIAQGYVINTDTTSPNYGWVAPGWIPNAVRNEYFADNVYPENGLLPGFEGVQAGHASKLNRPVTFQNPPPTGYAEAIYRPVDEVELDGEGIIMAPIAPLLTYSDVVPRPNGRLRQCPSDAEERGCNRTDPWLTDDNAHHRLVPVAASYIAARCMGLVAPLDALPEYWQATHASDETIPCGMVVVTDGEVVPTLPPAAWRGRMCLEVEYTLMGWYTLHGNRKNIYWATGTYKPGYATIPIYADPVTQTVPLYVRKLKVAKKANVPIVSAFIDRTEESTCGWYAYTYDCNIEEEEEPETVVIPRINCDGGTFVSADSEGTCTYQFPGDILMQMPRQAPLYSQAEHGYGSWEFKSCDTATGSCLWEFSPYRHDSFPFSHPFDTGVTYADPLAVTTKKSRAQMAWLPAICRTTDYNEPLVPGMKVQYTTETVDLCCLVHPRYVEEDYEEPEDEDEEVKYYDFYVPFTYAVVTPPDTYHTDITGTPELKIVKLTIEWPTEKEIAEDKIIADGDYWITNREYVDSFPTTRAPGELYYAAVELTDQYVPVIREAYGAFNDCENEGNLAVFMRKDAYDTEYTCCVRLNYIPYGYALPTKTPSCFFKATTIENCAPRMKGSMYDLYRQDSELYVKGACYIPCSVLKQDPS